MRRVKKEGLTEKILTFLAEKLKDLFELGITIVFDPQSLFKGFSLYQFPGLSPSEAQKLVQKRISNLKTKGYLKKGKRGWELTPKGRIEIIKIILWKKLENKKWDGKWRVIIFDIPEMSRRDRDFLRRELKWIGFIELQKSVWIFPYDMEKELMALLKLWKLEFKGDIRFLIVEKITEEEKLKKHFNLL
jgi:DNA-binding transcriptional regulator PaaX